MKPLSTDTPPEIEKLLIEGYRQMPEWRKLHCIAELNAGLRMMQMAEIRRRHPQADERELKLRLAARWIEPELMRRAFGWDPEREGY
ncbi:MAG: hypothetical protein HYR56_03100 [Acidobacteria bacterium]|nr:hypothetical protein [Acidobacteriota bacterium]MBI3423554.1 hypothetical protein [Acidobacteriota bacterium]